MLSWWGPTFRKKILHLGVQFIQINSLTYLKSIYHYLFLLFNWLTHCNWKFLFSSTMLWTLMKIYNVFCYRIEDRTTWIYISRPVQKNVHAAVVLNYFPNPIPIQFIVKILNLYIILSCTHQTLLSSIYTFKAMHSLLVTIILQDI